MTPAFFLTVSYLSYTAILDYGFRFRTVKPKPIKAVINKPKAQVREQRKSETDISEQQGTDHVFLNEGVNGNTITTSAAAVHDQHCSIC